MDFDKTKFKRLVHYVAWKAGKRDWFGATKLNKVLWFAEARQYVLTGKPITGAVYTRDKYGPVPRNMMAIRAELERDGEIKVRKEGKLIRITADTKPNLSGFSPQELQTVDYWIEHIDKDHTATSISDESHDYAWDIAAMGEELPLYAILANRIRDPNDRELDKLREKAKALGLI